MEDWTQYSARKRREIRLLRKAPLAPFPDPPPGLTEPAAEKLALFRTRKLWTGAGLYPETNWTGAPDFVVADHHFRYDYQRFDLSIEAPPVYPQLSATKSLTFYTCSGMAAIATAFMSLDRLANEQVTLASLRDAYFESQHLARGYARAIEVAVHDSFDQMSDAGGTSRIVLHLDSISADNSNFLKAAADARVVLVIFDTTCYARTDTRIAETVEALDLLHIPAALVRSHLKLDTLGLEIGRLGSLVLHQPGRCSTAGRKVIAGLGHLAGDVIRSLGLAASPDRFFPVRDTGELLELSSLRANRAADNCALLAEALEPELAGVVRLRQYQHGMFFSLHHRDWTSKEPVRDLVRTAVEDSRSHGGCAVAGTSFGFDFTVLTDVWDIPTERCALRVAPSDEPAALVLPLAAQLAKAVREAVRAS